jgi:hypothetical protein
MVLWYGCASGYRLSNAYEQLSQHVRCDTHGSVIVMQQGSVRAHTRSECTTPMLPLALLCTTAYPAMALL